MDATRRGLALSLLDVRLLDARLLDGRLLGASLLGTAAAAAPAAAETSPAPSLRVVSTFSILADIVRNVAGPTATVAELVGRDSDAHVFEPTPADAQRVAGADLVVVNGLGFEGWLGRLTDAARVRREIVVASRDVVPRRSGASLDPHAWHDLSNVLLYVATIRDALVRARPEQQAAITARAARYSAEIGSLHEAVKARFAAIPRPLRRVITSHDAFAYFGAAYGIDFLAPQSTSTESDPSAAAVAGLVDQIRRLQVRVVFVENISDPRLIERLAREGGATLGGKLYSDALSALGGPADTLLKLVAYNAATIARACSGAR